MHRICTLTAIAALANFATAPSASADVSASSAPASQPEVVESPAKASSPLVPPEELPDDDDLGGLLGKLPETEQTSSQQRSNVLLNDRSVVVVTARQRREMQASSVPDWIAEAPGVYVQKTNRAAGTPIIRGFVGPQNLFLVDGVRLNSSIYRTGPLQYLAITDPYAFDRVEILRGPGSALYGSDAFGGVVQMLSPDLDSWMQLTAHGLVGHSSADGAMVGAADASGGVGPVAGRVGVNVRDHGELRAGGGAVQPLSANRQVSARAQGMVRISEQLALRGAYLLTSVQDAGRSDRLYQGDYRLTDNRSQLAYLRAVYTARGWLEDAVVNISYQQLDERVQRYKCQRDTAGVVTDLDACLLAHERRLGEFDALTEQRELHDWVDTLGAFAHGRLAFLGGDLRLTLGAETYADLVHSVQHRARSDEAFAIRAHQGDIPDGARSISYGAYAAASWVPLRLQRWQLVLRGGLRFAGAQRSAADLGDFGEVNSGFNGLVGTAGVVVADPELVGFYLNFSQGFRAPNLQETLVIGDTGSTFEIANPALGPERTDTIELGVKLDDELPGIAHSSVRLNGAYFVSLLSDLIGRQDATYKGQSEVDGVPVKQRVNVEGGLVHGVEIDAAVRAHGFTVDGDLAYTYGELGSGDETEPARRIPPLSYRAGLRYDDAGGQYYLRGWVEGDAAQDRLAPGDQSDLRICENPARPGTLLGSCRASEAWTTVNVRGGYRLLDELWLDLALLNLTDQRYRSYGSGFDFAGLSARAALSYTY